MSAESAMFEDACRAETPPRRRWPQRRMALAIGLLVLVVALLVAQPAQGLAEAVDAATRWPEPWAGWPLVSLLGALSAAALAHAWRTARRFDACVDALAAASQLLQRRTQERDLALANGAVLDAALRRDTLTPLANRTAFFETLHALVERRLREGGRFAVFYIDLDNFKPVNDRFGHAEGDGLLRAFGARLRAAVRHGDLAARIGGDEFALVIDGLTPQGAMRVAQTLLDDLMQPYSIAGGTLKVSASLGIAAFPEDGTDAQQLLEAADGAMYRAKAAGKGGFMRSDWANLPVH